MPSIRDCAVTEQTTTATSVAAEMPAHQSGDVLLYFATKDSATVVEISDPGAPWTNLQNGTGVAQADRCGYLVATGSTHTLTLSTTGTAEEWHIVVIAIKDVHATTPINTSGRRSTTDATMPFSGVTGLSTSSPNCLIFYSLHTDSGLSPTAFAPFVNLVAGDAGTCSCGVAYSYMPADGSIPECTWFGRANDDTTSICVAVRGPATEVTIEPYADRAVTSGQVLRPMVGLSTMFSDSWPTSLLQKVLGTPFTQVWTFTPFVDETVDMSDPGTADVAIATAVVGDILYLGADEPFSQVALALSTAGTTGVGVWEYSADGSTWISSGMPTNNLTATTVLLTGLPVQSQIAVNSVTKYYIRFRITTSYVTDPLISQGAYRGNPTAYVVSSATADAGTNPYTDVCQDAGSSSVANLAGYELLFGAALDMDTGIIVGTYSGVVARDLGVDPALPIRPAGGMQIVLADGSDNYASYIIHSKGALSTDPGGLNIFAIDWNGAATAWAARGSVNKSAITRMMGLTAGYFGAAAVRWSMLSLITRIGFAGGQPATPLDFLALERIANTCVGIFPFFRRSGSAAMIYAPLQFGGGDAAHFVIDLRTFQFPKQYDGVSFFEWNAATNVAGVKFYPKSGDTLKITNCVFTSESAYRFEFDASAAAPATFSMQGTTVIGANVTLKNVGAFIGMSFVGCPTLNFSGCNIDSGVVSQVPSGNDTLTTSGTTLIENSDIDVSGVTAGNRWCSVANPEIFENNTFTGGGGHAIRITTPDTYDFIGNTFTSFGADGTNGAAILNDSGGLVTINVSGGTTPTVKNIGGASTVVNNNVQVTFTGMKDNTEVRVYDAGTGAEIAGIENATDGSADNRSFTWSDAVDNVVNYIIHSVSYETIRVNGFTVPGSNTSLPIQQRVDRNYENL